ncbi:MAG TPA: heavy metal translocating P-type ATPase [Chloroflexi bacterium]|nr:heavy metal translocating P-type ATPase [Chloroflexota bacterium]
MPRLFVLLNNPRNITTVAGILFIVIAFLLQLFTAGLSVYFFALGFVVGLYFPAKSGWTALKMGRGMDMNVLMVLAAVGAFITGQYGEAATVILLFNIGESLEGFVLEKSRRSIRALMKLSPDTARLVKQKYDCKLHAGNLLLDGSGHYDGGLCPWCEPEYSIVNVEFLNVGDLIVVGEGEKIPMDGVVIEGQSSVNQAPITGESSPIYKKVDDNVYAGTVNGDGTLEIEVRNTVQNNTLARMIHLIEESRDQKTPIQRILDRFANIYTPIVVISAIIISLVPPLVFGEPFLDSEGQVGWLYRGLMILVIACPCALLISTPVTIISAITSAAREGVLIKGGAFLESLGKTKVIAFDKTGTITLGKPELESMFCVHSNCLGNIDMSCCYCKKMVILASSVEQFHSHPFAKSIMRFAYKNDLIFEKAVNVEKVHGQAIKGYVDDHEIIIGRHEYFDTNIEHDHNFCEKVVHYENLGYSVWLVSEDQDLIGCLIFSDSIREDMQEVLNVLQDDYTCVMLTGDNDIVANTVAELSNIQIVHANLLPEEKVSIVRELRQNYGYVVMVGDGVNDSPALAVADVGIAMGDVGTAQALETADVVLMRDSIEMIPSLIHLGQLSLKIIRANIVVSLGLKGIFILAALFGVSTLWMAVLADMGATLLVTLNGMRLLRGGVFNSRNQISGQEV